MGGKLRPFEPLLMTLLRLGDGFLGALLFLGLGVYFGMYTERYPAAALLIFLSTLVTFNAVGLYKSWRTASLRGEMHQVLVGCLFVCAMLLSAGYLLKVSSEFSRRVLLGWVLLWPTLVTIERFVIRCVLRNYRSKGRNFRRVVIAGAGDLGRRLAACVGDNPWLGKQIIGFFDDKATSMTVGYPVLGRLSALPEYVRAHAVDVVYVALPMRAEAKIQSLMRDLADSTASVNLVPDIFFYELLLGGNVDLLEDIPVISLRETPFRGINGMLKRAEDLVLATLFLTAVSPVMLAIALGIKLTSRGPVLFRQWRYGLKGEAIVVYKFRTMTVTEDGYQFTQACKNDPRVTRLGGFLRRTSLDELPQFINVLQGRMSVVGPRPHPVALNEAYRKLVPGYMLRHKVRPGITGLAQVNGWRGQTDTLDKMEKRIECDLHYLQRWSLLLDLKIIAQTVWNNAWRTNAY